MTSGARPATGDRPGRVLLYGATGYTGRLIARLADGYGVQPVLAGRDRDSLARLGADLDLPTRAFALDTDVLPHLEGISVLLNCAGPFSRTHAPLARACIAAGVHYVDITGEIEVFEASARLDGAARAAGVLLLPGAGYDVVPTDCLAAHVATRLRGATRLLLGISGSGPLSRGTASTAIENSGNGGRIRRGGRIVRVPAAWRTRRIDFGRGPEPAITIPWGDVATAYYSTGVPDIEVYAAAARGMRAALRASRYAGWLLRRSLVRSALLGRVRAGPAGPSEHELEHGTSAVWARAEDARGQAAEARLHGPNGYTLTAHAALLAVRRALAGDAPPGFQTPSRAWGADFVLEVPGTRRVDIC